MLGFIYLIVVLLIGYCTWLDREGYRRQQRNDAYREGHLDYRGFKGEQWYGDRRAGVLYKDGDKCLVDAKDRNIVYINYSKQERERALERLTKASADSNQIKLMRCIGIYELGNIEYERSTNRPVKVGRNGNFFYKKYLTKEVMDGITHYWDGEEIEITPDEYNFLTTSYWIPERKRFRDGYGKEALLARKQFADANGIKLWDGNKDLYEVTFKTAEKDYDKSWHCFAANEDEAKEFARLMTKSEHRLEIISVVKVA